jgi:hypothetical protein
VQIVKPEDADDLAVQVTKGFLTEWGAIGGAAAVAVERVQFQRTIDQLFPNVGRLDEKALVALALALESVGRSEDAMAALKAQPNRGTDATGVLAGRLKRR